MRKMFKSLLTLAIVTTFAIGAIAQGTLKGKVIGTGTNEALPGANIVLKGTSNGTITAADGTFSLDVKSNTGVVVVSFIGYEAKSISFDVAKSTNLGTIELEADALSLQDIVVIGSGVIDVASNRITPIASTVVDRLEIQAKAVGNVEFPEVMKNTPNVYVSNQIGGYGDSQMYLRGFDQSNTAFLLNGQPINGMEDGNMYWSNWAGMSDIANAIDIQRGLGSSKLAISSVGGTVNIVTKATEKHKGGMIRFIGGNGLYGKATAAYNTGKMANGWGVSAMVDYWQGDQKWAEGTKGKGQNYFLSIGKEMENHNFNFMIFGAPQWHDQNYSKALDYSSYGFYDQDESGNGAATIKDISWEEARYNSNWGYLDGEYMTWRRNYYHKPVMNLNWDWNINDKSALSTVVYASFGRGGGTGAYGSSRQYNVYEQDNQTFRQIDFTGIRDANVLLTDKIGTYGTAAALRSSANNHKWYGAVTNYAYDANEYLTINVGADIRFYNGDHFRQLSNLLGLSAWEDGYGRYAASLDANGDYLVSNTYAANPWASLFNYAPEEDRIAYDNSEWINYQGVFGQLEYAKDEISGYFQGAVSNQSYEKEERFSADHERTAEKLYRLGYNVKAGGSYTVNQTQTFFANAGFYSRQPFLDNIFEYGTIEKRDIEVANEEITGLELGYKGSFANNTTINVNAYYTKWANRFVGMNTSNYTTSSGVVIDDAGIRMTSIAQVHKGIELEAATYITNEWKVRGYATFGNFVYDGSTPAEIIDNNDNQVKDNLSLDLTGNHVSDAPQTSFGLGTSYTKNGFKIYADANYYAKLYGYLDVADVAEATFNGTSIEDELLDNYFLVDAGVSYKITEDLKVSANIYNALNKMYISRKDSYGYYFGTGTTFNFGLTYNF